MTACIAGNGVVEGFQNFQVECQRWQASWQAEDFLAASEPAPAVIPDPWFPEDVNLSPHVAVREIGDVASASDPWSPVEFKTSAFDFSASPADPWVETARLPSFDPHARRPGWSKELFQGRFGRDAKSKAAWTVAILQPVTVRERRACQQFFEELFAESNTSRFFNKIRTLAAEADSPDTLMAAIQLRNLIEDSPQYRQIRVPGRYGIIYTQGQNLTWGAALRFAKSRCDFDPSEMIETEWLADWRKLRPHSEGYFSFLAYACHRAEHERFEDWDIPKSVLVEESRWLSNRSTPIDQLSGISVAVRTSQPAVPQEIARRFLEWREDIAKKSAPVHSRPARLTSPHACETSRSTPKVDDGLDQSELPSGAAVISDVSEPIQTPR